MINNKYISRGNFKILTLIVSLSFMSACIYGQNADNFPGSWVGRWKGNMEIFNGPVMVQTLSMQLHILPTDSLGIYTYRIIYGQDTVAGDRPYLLKVVNAAKGKYKIDEQNSIVVEATLLGNQLTSSFEVQGNLIFDILEKRGDTLYWRLISGKMEPIGTTGNTKQGDEDIPPVKTFPMNILQSAELKR